MAINSITVPRINFRGTENNKSNDKVSQKADSKLEGLESDTFQSSYAENTGQNSEKSKERRINQLLRRLNKEDGTVKAGCFAGLIIPSAIGMSVFSPAAIALLTLGFVAMIASIEEDDQKKSQALFDEGLIF
jgi:hypothetical protein